MKKVVFAATIAASLALPSIAMAQMTRGDQTTGWYVGASVGQSKLKDACSGIGSCDDKDTAWRILGGYQINRNFAAELGYHDLGKAKAGASDLKANAWELVGVGALPLANQFSVYGKLGVYHGQAKASGVKETNNDLTYGLGVQYDFGRQAAVRGEWQRYKDLGGDSLVKFDADVLSVGLLWRFR